MKSDRRKAILDILEKDGIVYLSKLSLLYPQISTMTLRRDLDYFENAGIAVRIHGGAQKKTAGSEPFYNLRANKNRTEKETIARLCLDFIEEGSSIFVDCGTTAMEFAKIIPNVRLSVITNAPNVGTEIAKKSNSETIILGGQLNRDNLSLTGKFTENFLDSLNIDTAFVSSSGFTVNGGFSCGSYNEAELKRKVLSKAQKRVILMDSSKFNKNFMFTFAKPEDVDYLVTDSVPSHDIAHGLSSASVKIITQNKYLI